MDESYLSGEPYLMPKAPGATVLSGAINGNAVLVIGAGVHLRGRLSICEDHGRDVSRNSTTFTCDVWPIGF